MLKNSEFWYLLNTNTEPNWIFERWGVELFILYAYLFHWCLQWIIVTYTEYLGKRINSERRNTDTALKIYKRDIKTYIVYESFEPLPSSYLPSIIMFFHNCFSWANLSKGFPGERERERLSKESNVTAIIKHMEKLFGSWNTRGSSLWSSAVQHKKMDHFLRGIIER